MGNARYYSLEIMLSPCLRYQKLKIIHIYNRPKYTTGETWCLTLREEQRFRVF